ncbi:hypothetical protein AFLA_001628 [Aspergillus flavus NRRL3357]|nr:hypothetical protein AFLA_001628 [Aspergillus flavus NRRL3357]
MYSVQHHSNQPLNQIINCHSNLTNQQGTARHQRAAILRIKPIPHNFSEEPDSQWIGLSLLSGLSRDSGVFLRDIEDGSLYFIFIFFFFWSLFVLG